MEPGSARPGGAERGAMKRFLDGLLTNTEGRLADTGVEGHLFPIETIVFDRRTILKCRYSCPAWGRRWTCNDDAWGPDELIPLLSMYKRVAVLAGVDGDELFPAALAFERAAFARGHYYALAVAVTPCYTCEACGYPREECRHKLDFRPESAMAGIDTLKTLDGLGIARTSAEGGFVRVSFVFLD